MNDEPIQRTSKNQSSQLEAIRQALDAAAIALPVLFNMCTAANLRAGAMAADEILGSVKYAQKEMAHLLSGATSAPETSERLQPSCKHDWVGDDRCAYCVLEEHEAVLSECESLLHELLDEGGVDIGFDDRLAAYWEKSKAAYAWRSRDLKLVLETDGWQPIETAPKDGRTLLLGYFNSHGKWRSLHGQWFPEGAMDEWDGPDYINPAGWYETSVENDDPPNCWATEPTHWQPTPQPPEKANRE